MVTACVLALSITTAQSSSDVDSTRAASNALGPAPLSRGLLLSSYMARDRGDTAAPAYLTLSLNPLTIQPYMPASRFDAAMLGAGTAGTLGMFIGALGNTFGLFDEKTTWMLTGALAAGGALYGGANYEVRATLRPESLSNIPSSDER
jgi:hypothetical protein